MSINKSLTLKLYLISFFLVILEISINSFALIYVDMVGVFLVILLVNKFCVFRQLIIISIMADLIGQWYLGTHLFTLILISFMSDKYYNFYKLSNFFQKNLFILICTTIQFFTISIIGIIAHHAKIDFLGFFTDFAIFCPTIFLITDKVANTTSTDIIY